MREKIKKFLKEVLKYIVLLVIVLNIVSYYKSIDLNKEKLDIKTFTLIDGSKFILQNDKPILINFWATWCPVCKLEESSIEKISKDFQVVTIATQSGSSAEVKEYLNKNNLSFIVVNDEDGTLAQRFNIKAYPTTFIYDKNQNLKFSEVGYSSYFGLYLRLLWSQF